MAGAELPGWVVPAFAEVAAVRRAAAGEETQVASWLAVGRALDWVGGVVEVAPLTMYRVEPAQLRVQAERLCAYELLTGRPAADAEYAELGYVPLAPDPLVISPDYGGGVWETLTWLLGESDHAPGLQYRLRRGAR
jgi:hypothetical protein